MQTLQTIQQTLSQISFLDWSFKVETVGTGFHLQVEFKAENIKTGKEEIQHGRKWYLSAHMTKSEIVQTAFKSVLTALEHEARENFNFKGQRIFQPHFDVDFLADFIQFNPEIEDVRRATPKNIGSNQYKEFTEEDAKRVVMQLVSNKMLDVNGEGEMNDFKEMILNEVKKAQKNKTGVDFCIVNICCWLYRANEIDELVTGKLMALLSEYFKPLLVLTYSGKPFTKAAAKLLLNNLNIEAELAISKTTEEMALGAIETLTVSAINSNQLPTDCALAICATLEIGQQRYHKQVQDFIEQFFDSTEAKSTNEFSETFNSPAYGKFTK